MLTRTGRLSVFTVRQQGLVQYARVPPSTNTYGFGLCGPLRTVSIITSNRLFRVGDSPRTQ